MFADDVFFAAGSFPAAITVGDFNGDGHVDLATANRVSRDVSVLLGRGDGSFHPAASFAVFEDLPDDIKTGDFNGDGRLDLATTFSLLLGHGDGSFFLVPL